MYMDPGNFVSKALRLRIKRYGPKREKSNDGGTLLSRESHKNFISTLTD
jgi:hypothetical protein